MMHQQNTADTPHRRMSIFQVFRLFTAYVRPISHAPPFPMRRYRAHVISLTESSRNIHSSTESSKLPCSDELIPDDLGSTMHDSEKAIIDKSSREIGFQAMFVPARRSISSQRGERQLVAWNQVSDDQARLSCIHSYWDFQLQAIRTLCELFSADMHERARGAFMEVDVMLLSSLEGYVYTSGHAVSPTTQGWTCHCDAGRQMRISFFDS
jgi:hypothetical protein